MYMNKIAAGAHTYGKPGEHSPERLARQYMPLVRKIAWHVHGRVSTAIEVEDLLQIGMVALVEAANSFEEPAAYREVADSVERVQHTSMDEGYSDQSMWFADVEDRADQVLERESLKKALAACIGELPQREAMVLQLYFVEEMNLEEIGQTLDIGAARVCQIKKAALDKLREKLRDWDE